MQDAITSRRRGGPPRQQAEQQSSHRGAELRNSQPGQRTFARGTAPSGEPAGRTQGGLTADEAPVRKHTPWLSGLVGDLLGQSPGNMPLSNSTSELPKHPTSPEFASGKQNSRQRTVGNGLNPAAAAEATRTTRSSSSQREEANERGRGVSVDGRRSGTALANTGGCPGRCPPITGARSSSKHTN